MSALVSAPFVQARLPLLRVLDCSWFIPGTTPSRSGRDEFASIGHIPGAQFFDVDSACEPNAPLPHTMPRGDHFANYVCSLGVSSASQIVCYDSAGVFASARAWYMFRYFGHRNVSVLNGGLPAWSAMGYALERGPPQPVQRGVFVSGAPVDNQRLVSYDEIIAGIKTNSQVVIDARPAARFNGTTPEPRPTKKS
jgi:thiosulfate/3-mercaptopyruvate sulfurtransferase